MLFRTKKNFQIRPSVLGLCRGLTNRRATRFQPHTQNKNASVRSTTKKSTTTAQNDNYFVIHSTEGNLKDNVLQKFVDDKKQGAGHAYINKNLRIVHHLYQFGVGNARHLARFVLAVAVYPKPQYLRHLGCR